MDNKILAKKTVAELKKLAAELKISGASTKTKPQLIELIASKSGNLQNNNVETSIAKTEEVKPLTPETIEKSEAPSQSTTIAKQAEVQKPVAIKKASPVKSKKAIVESKIEAKQTEQVEPTQKPANEVIVKTASKTNEVKPNQAQTVEEKVEAKAQIQPQNSGQQGSQNNNQNRQNNFNQNRNQNFRQDNRNNQNRNNQQNRYLNNQGNSQNRNDTSTSSGQVNSSQGNSFPQDPTVEVTGILDIVSDGTHGVLRTQKLIPTDKDTYISISQVKKLKLRKGDVVIGTARLPKENERYFSLLWIKSVNGILIDELKDRPHFDDLKPVYPDKQMTLEAGQFPISNRIIDLLAPIGFGQRAMIVAPPKAGKTTLLKDIAKGINENQPDVTLMVVLIGERPEEVTDIERSVKGIVYASNFDDSPANQVMVAELSLERAKRMVESGQDVIILMDSLTRLARAYNVALPASGRTLSGGLDPVSLYPSKRFFGAARNFENGASLTIVATSLVDTGSKMDDVIFEEFKGTGNMELKLDRRMANKRIFPAINLLESGTRNEELLLGNEKLQNSWKIRRMLESLGDEGNEALIDRMKGSKSNEEFLNTLHQY